jgi:spore coat protein H
VLRPLPVATALALLASTTGCADTGTGDPALDALLAQVTCDSTEAIEWSEASHQKGADADYATVFPDDTVKRLDIVMCSSDWDDMQADMTDLYGEFGADPGGGGGPPGGGGGPGGDPGGGAPTEFAEDDPIYVPAHLVYEGRTWPMVGMRYKGNSTLQQSWAAGILKIGFRLNLDYYEDEVASVGDQRLFGFKELKFGNAMSDDSLVRDRAASATFRDAGVPAASGTFVRVYVDTGDGPTYWGVYSMFEDPSNSLLDDWFGSDDGNCYKPESYLAEVDDEAMEKCNNEDAADYSDITALIETLEQADGSESWRADLEAVLDVDGYLRYQALNGLLANWDSYGLMPHNYYLYADPDNSDRLTWIPWDFNMSYSQDGMQSPALSLGLAEVGDDWPLIRATMDDTTYRSRYLELLAEHLDGAFDEDTQIDRISAYHTLVAPYVNGEIAEEEAPYTHLDELSDFEDALEELEDEVNTSRANAQELLGR